MQHIGFDNEAYIKEDAAKHLTGLPDHMLLLPANMIENLTCDPEFSSSGLFMGN